jgi:hypothetical protein
MTSHVSAVTFWGTEPHYTGFIMEIAILASLARTIPVTTLVKGADEFSLTKNS